MKSTPTFFQPFWSQIDDMQRPWKKIIPEYKDFFFFNFMEVLPNSSSAAYHLRIQYLRDRCWRKGKIALLRKPAILGRRWTHVPKNQLPIANQWARAPRGQFQGCIDAAGRLHVEQHSQLWKWSWTWSCDSLIGIILIVLSIVSSSSSFQFQGQFVPISLRPVLKIVAAYVVATSWSLCN